MKLNLFVKLEYESTTTILFVGIRYSTRDLLSDLNNYAWPRTSDMRQKRQMTSAFSLASVRLSKLWILCLNDFLDRNLCKNLIYFYFYGFQIWFY